MPQILVPDGMQMAAMLRANREGFRVGLARELFVGTVTGHRGFRGYSKQYFLTMAGEAIRAAEAFMEVLEKGLASGGEPSDGESVGSVR